MKKRTDVLVVYGYHRDERFAFEIGKELEKLGRSDFIIKQYDKPVKLERDLETGKFIDIEGKLRKKANYGIYLKDMGTFNRFVKNHASPKYVVDLHNSGPISWEEYLKEHSNMRAHYPSVQVFYESKLKIGERLQDKIMNYCGSKDYIAIWSFIPNKYHQAKTSDRISLEYFPYIKKNEALDFALGFIDLLYSQSTV